mmetsp:Transcript_20694/g.63958  ORF Transcript_20694/g.63958 Transcript_20694/m.63958 type:complete len:290 (-) Transcript_20694:107-976(-)
MGQRDLVVEALRETLAEVRIELERARRNAAKIGESEAATSAKLRELRYQMESAREDGERERRAFGEREALWAKRCAALSEKSKDEASSQKTSFDVRVGALKEELRRSLDGKALAEEALLRERRVKDGLLASSEAARRALVKENVELRSALARARDATEENVRASHLARDRHIEALKRTVAELRHDASRLRDSLAADGLRQRTLRDDNARLSRQLAAAAADIDRERQERVRWARARIDVLTNFSSSDDTTTKLPPPPGLSSSALYDDELSPYAIYPLPSSSIAALSSSSH